MLVLSLLFSSKSYSWALDKVEPQTITSIVPRVAIQIDFIGPTPNPGLQSVFGVAAALEAYGRWLGAACHTVTFCSEEGFEVRQSPIAALDNVRAPGQLRCHACRRMSR
jgi:hypothetical protein